MTLHPVILSGGSGTRLWPLSRQDYPKQFMALTGDNSLFQDTVTRLAVSTRGGGAQGPAVAPPIIVCSQDHRFIIAEQLRACAISPAALLLEPHARNTAPAAAVAALRIVGEDPEGIIVLMPSDHLIGDVSGFAPLAHRAATLAHAHGVPVTLGITPTRPDTGYGYIRAGTPLEGSGNGSGEPAHRVARFVEKPDAATAERFLADGGYYWNSGIFILPAARYLADLERLHPDMLAGCRRALARAHTDMDFCRLDAEAFGRVPAVSIDHAVMEHIDDALVLPMDMGWSDVGAWSALWDVGTKDDDGSICLGDVMSIDTTNSYVRSEGPLTAVLGLDGVAVVATDDAILVAARDRVQDVKGIVEHLRTRNRPEAVAHPTVYRPWGSYRGIDAGPGFQVKHITVKPGASLSLQMHHHRAEHWVVVHGTARVTNGTETFLLHENQSTYIPLGRTHRLENPGKLPLSLIEVQSGSYLGEDDIIRMADSFGRV